LTTPAFFRNIFYGLGGSAYFPVFILGPPTLTLPLAFDPEALDGEGGGEGGGDSFWLRLCRVICIGVHPRPKNSSEFVGATRRVARTEFGVKVDKALFFTLGTLGTLLPVFICVPLGFCFAFRLGAFFIRVYPCSSVSNIVFRSF
jgi:hypothetical protein